MNPDEKIQALKNEIAVLDKAMAAATDEDSWFDLRRQRDDAVRDITILEKFQNADRDLLPSMETLLRATVKADQEAHEAAAAELAESTAALAELERFKQLLSS